MALVTALAAFFVTAGFSAAAATFIATTILNVGISLVTGFLNRPSGGGGPAIRSELEAGAGTPASAVFGKVKKRGQIAHYNRYGKGNKYNQFVYVLSNGWCDGLEPYVFIGDEKKTLTPIAVVNDEIARYTVEDYGDAIEILFFDGRPGQAACAELVANANPAGSWTEDDVLAGCCYVVELHTWKQKFYKSGIPQIEYVLRGLRCYDWRKDSTMAGGSGSHRLANSATWEWTENPAVARYNYQIGLRGLSSGEAILGEGIPQAGLDHDSYTFSANACDATRTVEGETVPAYVIGMEVRSDEEHKVALDRFDNAMAGYGVERSGLSGVLAGAPQVPVMTLAARDLRLDDELVRQPRRPRNDRFNVLYTTFTNPESLYEFDSLEPVSDAGAITIDKRVIPAPLDLTQVNRAECATYVAQIRYRQNRRMAAIRRMPVTARVMFKAPIGSWVVYDGKSWLVEGTELTPDFKGYLDLAETDAAIYSETGLLPPSIVPAPVIPDDDFTASPAGFTPAPTVVTGPNGRQVPALRLPYTVPDDADITAILFEYRQSGGSQVFVAREAAIDGALSGEHIVDAGVVGGVVMQARAAFETDPPRAPQWTAWINAAATAGEIVPIGNLGAEIREAFDRSRRDLDRLKASLVEGVTALQAETAEAFIRREEIAKKAGDALAAVIAETQVRANADEAFAAQLSAVSAYFGNNSADGLFKIEARATPDNAAAEIALLVRAGIGDEWKEAGIILGANAGAGGSNSFIANRADQWLMVNSNGDIIGGWINGELVSPFANLGTVTAGLLQSPDTTFRLDLANKNLRFNGTDIFQLVSGKIQINGDLVKGGALATLDHFDGVSQIEVYDADFDYVEVTALNTVWGDFNPGPPPVYEPTGIHYMKVTTGTNPPTGSDKKFGDIQKDANQYPGSLTINVLMPDIADNNGRFRSYVPARGFKDCDWIVKKYKLPAI